MAKALVGHLAAMSDRRLLDELTYLRSQVGRLTEELARVRAERDAALALDRAFDEISDDIGPLPMPVEESATSLR
ncbi:MAG: hypothetical protein DLM56_13995 [Pseudonocardiales bacterium]|nr:MAG: hypothetical protein DLM56_13995 [Pseudonocardiales bacterium]